MYCTQADIEDRVGQAELLQLTDRARLGQIDAVTVARAIADASAEIDGYVAARYALPFSAVPPVLVRVAVDIAVYNLFSNRRGGGVIDDIRNRYKDVVRLLENIASGKVQLGQTPEPVAVESDIVIHSAASAWSRPSAEDAA